MIVRNTDLAYLPAGEGQMVVFDPESGDAHFLDDVGAEILALMEEPTTSEQIADKLSAVYDGDPVRIRADVEAFMRQMRERRIIRDAG